MFAELSQSLSTVTTTVHDSGLPGIAAANADHGDGRAGETDGDVEVLHHDAQGREDGCYGRASRGRDRLAALEGPGAAGPVCRRCGGGDGKDCEGGEREELGEHVGEEEEYLNDW